MMRTHLRPAIAVFLLAAPASASAQTDATAAIQAAGQLAREGRTLSAPQAAAIENQLTTMPEDLAARTRLLGYYFAASLPSAGPEATKAARRRHIVWMIEHHPEAEAATLSEMTIDPSGHALADPEGYEQAKKAWIAALAQHKDNVRVQMHAAKFFRLPDRGLAIDCLKRAVALAPGDAFAASELGYTYAITASGITMINNNGLPMGADPAQAASPLAQSAAAELRASTNAAVVSAGANVLSQYGTMARAMTNGKINVDALAEELLKKASALDPADFNPPRALGELYKNRMLAARSDDARKALAKQRLEQDEIFFARVSALKDPRFADWKLAALAAVAKAAIDADDGDRAQRFADELLSQGTVARPLDGQFVHDSHSILGRVALRRNNVAEAKRQLLEAGKVTGGGTLTSFGPNMTLAKELVEKGERETVVSYLEACRKFWPNPRLAEWIKTIQSGGTPEFGPNLNY